MKIWTSYGSEHSANLVIVGEFDSDASAQKALTLLDQVTQVAIDHPGTATTFSKEMTNFIRANNLYELGYRDQEELCSCFYPKQKNNQVVVTTDESDVGAILKILIHEGAKIRMYSAHDHPNG